MIDLPSRIALGAFFAINAALFWLWADWFIHWLKAPKLQLKCPSGSSWGAKFWNSHVWYDASGTPYARAKDIGQIRLLPHGKTDDCTYKTTWVHVSGPEVRFSRDPTKTEGL